MNRAVQRGLARRKRIHVKRFGVDETSFQKRHEYVTIVTDLVTGCVLYVADDRKRESLAPFFRGLTAHQLANIETVAMDMHGAFIGVVRDHLPDAELKIAFDKFHVAQHLGDAVDRVRRDEHRTLLGEGSQLLKGSKYLWPTNPDNFEPAQAGAIEALQQMNLKTGRAWLLKETAMCIWRYVRRGTAERAWTGWLGKAMRSRLEPIKKVARMIREHLWGIVNAMVAMALQATSAASESVNPDFSPSRRRRG